MRASTSSRPISADEKLGESSNWIHQRLYGDDGVISKVVEIEGFDFTEDAQNDFYVEGSKLIKLQCFSIKDKINVSNFFYLLTNNASAGVCSAATLLT